MLTQNASILSYLKSGNEISPIEALNIFGSLRLSARIFELRDQGWDITCDRRDIGNGRRVGFYSLAIDSRTT